MPNPLLCMLILVVIFFVLLALCIFTQFCLLVKGTINQDPPEDKPQIYKIKRTNKPKKRKPKQDDTITIEGRLITPDEFKREG